jgi:hypothetical protein
MASKPAPYKSAGRKAVANDKGADANDDVALICGVAENGSDLHVVRRRNNRIETGTVRALREGQPIQGELVRLRPRERFPLLCDVEVELEVTPPDGLRHDTARTESNAARVGLAHGPAQVASDSYRKNWDAIWKRPAASKKLVN